MTKKRSPPVLARHNIRGFNRFKILKHPQPSYSTIYNHKKPPIPEIEKENEPEQPKRGPSSQATHGRRASRMARTRNKRFEPEKRTLTWIFRIFKVPNGWTPGSPRRPGKKNEPQKVNKRNNMKRAGEAANCPTWPPFCKIPFSYKQTKGQTYSQN